MAGDRDEGYHSDERSGDEVTDSEMEFDKIVELDSLVKSFHDNVIEQSEMQTKII